MSMWDDAWGTSREISEDAAGTSPHAEGVVFTCLCPKCNMEGSPLVTWSEIMAAFAGQTAWAKDKPSVGLAQENNRVFLATTQQCRCGNLLRLFEDVHTIRNMFPGQGR